MRRKLLASLLAIVMVISLVPATVLAADFADTNGHWGEAAIDRWADVGILNGKGEGNFDPDGSMTRAEFAQMLATMMGYTARVPNNFTDVPAGAWYEDAMLKLVAAGVLSGNGDGTATPNDPITREQAAVLLCRAFNLEPSRNASLNYQDSASISSWARDAMAALAERGMMSGVGDNTAAPQLNINRASVATLADNMIAEYVTESKTITGRVDGIILVAGGASVNLDNATISEPVIIAPKASGVSVNLTGSTTADDIVIEANSARVSVGANASASSVKAESNSASVSVAGTVSSVDVTGTNGKVTVTGSVGTVSTEATGTSITVSGTVNNVDIAESASRASVTASAGGKIDSVTTDASNVTVSGSGTVGSVTATGGSVDVTTKGTEVTNRGASDVTASGSTVSSGSTATSTGAASSNNDNGGDDDDSGYVSGGTTGGGDANTPDNPGDVDPTDPDNNGEWKGITGTITKISDTGTANITVTGREDTTDTTHKTYTIDVTGKIANKFTPTAEGSSGLPAYWAGVNIPTPTDWQITKAEIAYGSTTRTVFGGVTAGGDEPGIDEEAPHTGDFDMWFDVANGIRQTLTLTYAPVPEEPEDEQPDAGVDASADDDNTVATSSESGIDTHDGTATTDDTTGDNTTGTTTPSTEDTVEPAIVEFTVNLNVLLGQDDAIIAAPLVDHGGTDNAETDLDAGTLTFAPASDIKLVSYASDTAVYNVTVGGTVNYHKNADGTPGFWVGIGIPQNAANRYLAGGGSQESASGLTINGTSGTSVYTGSGGSKYDTFYFQLSDDGAGTTLTDTGNHGFVAVQVTGDSGTSTRTIIYNITFKVTLGTKTDVVGAGDSGE